jgi:CRP-like cAMP-binding protein
MSAFSTVQLPAAFTQYIEDNYYAQVTAQSRLEAVVRDPEFLKNPLKHVALFSDHGVLHGRDIAGKIVQAIRQIHGLLIPVRSPARLEFMLGYGVMLAYLHDIGMRNFSAFGRAMHPEFAAQLVFTPEFDEWIELLWQENAGNVAWRLMNLSLTGNLSGDPKRVFREMLSLSMAHSKSKVPIDILNDVHHLHATMQRCVSTGLYHLYCQQQVERIRHRIDQELGDSQERDRLATEFENAKAQLDTLLSSTKPDQRINPDIARCYEHLESFQRTAFSWLISPDPDIQQLTLDAIDTVRALRCADALRQRGTTFTTSAGYDVIVNPETANAVYALQSGDRAQQFLLEGKDPISAGEANMANSMLDREGNLRLSFTRGAFATPEATRWAAYSAAVVVQDIQADVVGSFRRSPQEQAHLRGAIKLEDEMQILVEGVDDNPEFAELICQELRQINPALAPRIQPVTSLQNADLSQVERYLSGVQINWELAEKLNLLDQLVKTGHQVDHIDLDCAFAETRCVTVKAGEVLMEAGISSGFVYIPLGEGLKQIGMLPGATECVVRSLWPWVPLGDFETIRETPNPYRVIAEQTVDLLAIPQQIYRRHWYAPYSVEDFTQLFAGGETRPNLPTRRATSLEQDVQRLTRRGRTVPLAIHLMRLLPDGDSLRQFMSYLEEITLSEGASLFKAGDRPEALYFLEFGRIATMHPETLEPIEVFQPGDLIGGWAFFSGVDYPESAIAQRSSTVHRLSAQSLQQMQTAAPQVANQFANHLLTVFAEQIQQAQRAIASLHQERTETIGRLSTS